MPMDFSPVSIFGFDPRVWKSEDSLFAVALARSHIAVIRFVESFTFDASDAWRSRSQDSGCKLFCKSLISRHLWTVY